MAPYFETVKSFATVRVTDAGVDTAEFLEASDGLLDLFDLFGTGVFSFVQADIRGNVAGVRHRYIAEPALCTTLEQLVRSERGAPDSSGTGCLRRLLRGLAFTCRALQNSRAHRSEELHTSFRRAYDAVLRHHHNFLIRGAVYGALQFCPRRRDFYARIAQGAAQERLDAELAKWLTGLDAIVRRMAQFYERGGHGKI